ncbi:MAG: sugar phosphate isomerase/epimerase family protein [Candidatus Latescibacteria bacterium]|jgi:sugar phosphate isomerase/epimerase|nr:sugar phosphate isomerase/epimerase family protein [Candidatus Latescibacterota bacterium]
MRISLFSQSLFALPLREAIGTTADIGFHAIELACREPHLGYEIALRNSEGIAEQIRQAGLAVSALSLFSNLTEQAGLRNQVKMAGKFIALAPLFDTKLIKMTPGPPASLDAEEKHWQCLADSVNELVPMARDAGVKLAFETHMRQLTDTLSSTERFLEMTPSDCVGLTVDFSNLSFAGEKMPQVVALLKDRMYHTHIKNGYIDSEGGWDFRSLDTGLTDYSMVLPLLMDTGYNGYLSIECVGQEAKTDPAQTAQRDLAILDRYLEEAGCKI